MSRCIHVYSFVARNHGGIPFSGVCPIFFIQYHLCTFTFFSDCLRNEKSFEKELIHVLKSCDVS